MGLSLSYIDTIGSFITRSLGRIYSDFQKTLKGMEQLCELAKLRFDSGNIPDYSIGGIQQLYLLRYMYAYVTEYKLLFDTLFDFDFIKPNDIKVYSIGAGCGLEFYGLFYSMKEKKINLVDSHHYRGIDKINWSYKDLLKISPDINLLDINGISRINYKFNVLIFPKSISEFDDATFEKLKKIIDASINETEKIAIISSFRESITNDFKRIEEISEIFESHNYNLIDQEDLDNYRHYKDGTSVYSFIYEGYPNKIQDFITDLMAYCKTEKKHNSNNCDKTCSDVFSRNNPIFVFDYVKFQIIRFQKQNDNKRK